MGARGKKAASELAVVKHSDLITTERPAPPSDLTDEQSFEWLSVVNRMVATWFPRETHALLTQYCRHVVAARRVAQLIGDIEQQKDFSVQNYDTLLRMQEREGRAIASLSTKMRLSQQTTIFKETKKPTGTRKPWEAQPK